MRFRPKGVSECGSFDFGRGRSLAFTLMMSAELGAELSGVCCAGVL